MKEAKRKDETDQKEVLLNLKLFREELLTFINGYPFKGFYFPVRFLSYEDFTEHNLMVQLHVRTSSVLRKVA